MEQRYKIKSTKTNKRKKKFKRYIKQGFCKKTGKQKWYDKKEKRYFFKDYSKRGYSDRKKNNAIKLAFEGNSFRSIGRLLNISYTCAFYWIRDYAKTLSIPIIDRTKKCTLELDELWHFCQKKRKENGYGQLSVEKQR